MGMHVSRGRGHKPRNSAVVMLPCLSVSFSLHSFSSSRQQPWICLRSLLSMGSQFCRGGVPTGVCGEGQEAVFQLEGLMEAVVGTAEGTWELQVS